MYKDFALNVAGYFAKKASVEKLTEEEIKLHEQAIACKDCYPISCLSEDDLVTVGFDISDITREKMNYLASKMGDDYNEQLFWYHLPAIAKSRLNLPLNTNE